MAKIGELTDEQLKQQLEVFKRKVKLNPEDDKAKKVVRLIKKEIQKRSSTAAEVNSNPSNYVSSSSPELAVANCSIRFWARLIDGIILLIVLGIISIPQMLMSSGSTPDPENKIMTSLVGLITAIFQIVVIFYFEAYCLKNFGGTPGKRYFSLKVIPMQGNKLRLSWKESIIRSFGYLVSNAFNGVPLIVALFSPLRRNLPDLLAGTRVINQKGGEAELEKRPLLGIFMIFMMFGPAIIALFFASTLIALLLSPKLSKALMPTQNLPNSANIKPKITRVNSVKKPTAIPAMKGPGSKVYTLDKLKTVDRPGHSDFLLSKSFKVNPDLAKQKWFKLFLVETINGRNQFIYGGVCKSQGFYRDAKNRVCANLVDFTPDFTNSHIRCSGYTKLKTPVDREILFFKDMESCIEGLKKYR